MTTIIQPPSWIRGSLGDEAVIGGYINRHGGEVMSSHTDPIASYDEFVFIACDTLDGRYGSNNLNIAINAAYLMPVKIVNASWSENPAVASVGKMKRLLDMGVSVSFRDSDSRDRFAKLMPGEYDVRPDYAFSFLPNKAGRSYKTGKYLICPCELSLNSHTVIRSVSSENSYGIVHDFRGNDKNIVDRCFPGKTIYAKTAIDIRNVCMDFDYVITGRMHMGIAAICSGIPAIMVDYNNKAKAIWAQAGLGHLITSQSNLFKTHKLFLETL